MGSTVEALDASCTTSLGCSSSLDVPLDVTSSSAIYLHVEMTASGCAMTNLDIAFP